MITALIVSIFKKQFKMKRTLFLVILTLILSTALFGKQIKVLAVGNSFSDDAMVQYLHGITAAAGDEIIIGIAYIGGSSLEQHHNNSVANSPAYLYIKVVNGVRTDRASTTLDWALKDEVWDYISFQQVSQNSGKYDTYFPYLTNLMTYAKGIATNPNVEFILHSTWAYAQNSNHSGFVNYGNNQMTMYKAIVDATKRAAETAGITLVIPAGTAIQNARTSTLGDTFTRDGYHLELTYGRYTASCTWFEKLFEKTVVGNTFAPGLTDFQKLVAQTAAHNAVANPLEITSLSDLVDETPKTPFTKPINLSFAGAAYEGWNILGGFQADNGIPNLKDNEGNLTGVSVKITERFGGVNFAGSQATNTTMNLPKEVTKDNFFGNTGTFGGGEFPKGTFVISSLEPDEEYDFKIFASRMSANDNREAYYKFSGAVAGDTTLYLDASNNETKIVEAYKIKPNSNGEIVVEVGKGPNNNNSLGFFHITAIKIVPNVEITTVPFTEQINVTFAHGPLDITWNVLGDFRENAKATYLRDINGDFTDISLEVVERFNHINGNGPTETNTDMDMPAGVSKDSYYGNTATWMGIIVPKSKIKLVSLDPALSYDFSIFGSRMGSTDNRETYYSFSGATVNDTTLYLDASDNNSKTVKALGIQPNAEGEIYIEMGPGPKNNNPTGFYYITALNIKPSGVSSALNTVRTSKLDLYPNPFKDLLNVYIKEDVGQVQILSPDGRTIRIFDNLIQNSYNNLPLSDLNKGLYIIKAGADTSVIVKK